MKKYYLIISTLFLVFAGNSCSERDLDLFPEYADEITNVNSESQLQQLLNGAYLNMAHTEAFGTEVMLFGDLLSDNMFVSNTNGSYITTANFNYNSTQNQFSFYSRLYNVIAKCNLVINNTIVTDNANTLRIKGEAKIIRGYAYFTLVNYYSPSPTSGVNQEYGVPLVLGEYDVNIVPARATIAQVYDQIILDLTAGTTEAPAVPKTKETFSQTAAKLLLSKVYLTRRAAGDGALALQYATQIVDSSPADFAKIDATGLTRPYNPTSIPKYEQYFTGTNDATVTRTETYLNIPRTYTLDGAENQPETIWELDVTPDTSLVTGIGSNISLPGYYSRIDPKKCMLFNQTFYASFAATDVRRGRTAGSGLLINSGVPATDNPKGYWTNKYPRLTERNNYFRNIKVLRFAEAQLNQIEALQLTGQTGAALTKLNAFALSRNGSTYTGANLLGDILDERAKEFYAEGQRFLDLKRYNLPVVRPSNCTETCTVPANDKLFTLPLGNGALNSNPNLVQYPGYN